MRLKPLTKLLIIIIVISTLGCAQSTKNETNKVVSSISSSSYDLKQPDLMFKLPYDLEEISGLSYFRDSIVVAVQDEVGKLFFYDYNLGKVVEEYRFGKDGDYEGVELAGQSIYIVKANGDLFELDISSKNVNKIETPLNSKNDIEGLAYDKISNQLILACKGSSDIGDNDNKGKGFYRFDLTNRRLDENPWLVLPNKKIQKFIKSKGGKRKVSEFKPSGVAIHPITNEVYILAHGGKWLVTLSQSMEVSAVYSLKHKLFGQPEGICFTPSGDLLISNEGQGDRGTLLFYKYQK